MYVSIHVRDQASMLAFCAFAGLRAGVLAGNSQVVFADVCFARCRRQVCRRFPQTPQLGCTSASYELGLLSMLWIAGQYSGST